jgi:hypothetical protein
MHFENTVCPNCGRDGGELDRVQSPDSATFRLSLRCDWCRRRWSVVVSQSMLPIAARLRLAGQSAWPPPAQ